MLIAAAVGRRNPEPLLLRDKLFGLAAQNLGFQPMMEVKPEFLFSMRRDSVTELIEPLLCLADPAACFLGLPKAVIGQDQLESVDDGAAQLGISLETLLGEAGRDLKPSHLIHEAICNGRVIHQHFSRVQANLFALRRAIFPASPSRAARPDRGRTAN
jgi:hypothetical protein